MVVTLGQQYNIGEKPTVILYTYINPPSRDNRKPTETKKLCSTSSNMVVIIYCYIPVGYENKATTWYYSTQFMEVVNT